jgi:hypothetical protein
MPGQTADTEDLGLRSFWLLHGKCAALLALCGYSYSYTQPVEPACGPYTPNS